MTIEHLSFSSISKAYQCPKFWKATYLDKLRTPSSEAATWGTHYGMVLQSKLVNKPLTAEEENGIEADIYEAVEEYFSHPKSWTAADEVEKEINIDPEKWRWLAEKYGANSELFWPIMGYMDAVRDGVPMDLKTTKRAGFQSSWAYQCTLYALSQNSRKWEVHSCVRNKTLKYNFYFWHLSDENIRSVMNWISNGAKKIKSMVDGINEPEEQTGYWCGFCPVMVDCGVYPFENLSV